MGTARIISGSAAAVKAACALVALFIATTLPPSLASAADTPAQSTEAQPIETTDEIIVTYKDEPGFDVVEPHDGQSVADAMGELASDPDVATVEQNQVFHMLETVNDPYASSSRSYHLAKHDFFGAWDLARASGNVTVAVLDTGVSMPEEYRMMDLAENVDYDHAWDATKGKALASTFVDLKKHGTEVATCISAMADNYYGLAGVSYNAKILPVNVFDGGETTTKTLLAAYEYVLKVAAECNVKVINMSLGGEAAAGMNSALEGSPSLQQSVNKAFNQGILTIAAAGNHEDKSTSSSKAKCYPASLERVVSVAAVDKYSVHPWWSYHNSAVDICAAGVDVPIAHERYILLKYNPFTRIASYQHEVSYTDEDALVSGTSFSAPIVSGAAALVFAANPSLSPGSVERVLEATAMDLGDAGKDEYYGNGALNAAHAVRAATESPWGTHKLKRTVQVSPTYSKRGSYHYACDTCGYEFTLSSSIPKKAATLKSLTAGKGQLVVKWAKANGVSGYRIQFRKSGTTGWTTTSAGKSKTKITLTGLKSKTKYQVRMRAYTKSGSSTIYSSYSSKLTKKTK